MTTSTTPPTTTSTSTSWKDCETFLNMHKSIYKVEWSKSGRKAVMERLKGFISSNGRNKSLLPSSCSFLHLLDRLLDSDKEVDRTLRTANRLVSKKSTKFNWTMAKKILLAFYVSVELILHGLAFFTVNDMTKNYNIFFDTILFSYLSLSRKRCGKHDYNLYSLLALEHIIFLAIKVVSPSLYLVIFVTKDTMPLLYNTATFVECVAYSKVLVGL